MSDNLKKTGSADDKRININQPHEVQYWTKALGVTEEKLSAAVKAAGPMVADVKKIWESRPETGTQITGPR